MHLSERVLTFTNFHYDVNPNNKQRHRGLLNSKSLVSRKGLGSYIIIYI